MDEQFPAEHPSPRAPDEHEPTGDAAVDAALESLEVLDDLTVDEHVAVFESAHDRLRAALGTAGDGAGGVQ